MNTMSWDSGERDWPGFGRSYAFALAPSQIEAGKLRWSTWRDDIRNLSGDRCFAFYPFLWTKEGSPEDSYRKTVPVSEVFDMKADIARQLSGSS
jgi:hypothetical protein